MSTSKAGDGRGRNPNSRANLRRGAGPKAPETLPEILSAPQIVPAIENQRVGRTLAVGIMENTAPAAATVVQRIVTGGIRAAPHVRLDAARLILEAVGAGKQPQLPDDAEDAFLERIREAFELRRRKAEAIDAEQPKP